MVYPYQADQDGNFLSHDLKPHSDIIHSHRHRRSTSSLHSSSTSQNAQRTIFYKFHTPTEDFHFELVSRSNLLAPGFKVYHHGNRLREASTRGQHGRNIYTSAASQFNNCFYTGKIKNQENSTVALSLCNGLVSRKCIMHVLFCFALYSIFFLMKDSELQLCLRVKIISVLKETA